MFDPVGLSRGHMLRLCVVVCFAGFPVLSPACAYQATAPKPPLPASVEHALDLLASLGFQRSVDVYQDLRPTIEVQPPDVLTWGGLTEGWANPVERFGLPASCLYLRSVADYGIPETLEHFATRSSCGVPSAA
jgi:hypothetical protein